MGIDCASAPEAGRLIDALQLALLDPLPGARLAAVMQLAWMRHPRAEAALLAAFQREAHGETRAQMLSSIANLMSPVAPELIRHSLSASHTALRQAAEYLRDKGFLNG
jgi:hypothetical protein